MVESDCPKSQNNLQSGERGIVRQGRCPDKNSGELVKQGFGHRCGLKYSSDSAPPEAREQF